MSTDVVQNLGPQASRLPGSEEGYLRNDAGETPAVPGKEILKLHYLTMSFSWTTEAYELSKALLKTPDPWAEER